jgi:plasmid stabilization system protein ParE
MPYEVNFTRRSLADIDAAVAWRTWQSAAVAARWRTGLLGRVATLEQSPDRCPLADEAGDLGLDLRKLLDGRGRIVHRILFPIEGQTVVIHRVRQAAQDRLAPDDV